MLFDAGRYGMVEVDEIIEKEDRKIGIKDFDRLTSVTYINYGEKQGCAKVTTIPPQDPANRGEEARKRTQRDINNACNRILQNRRRRLTEEENGERDVIVR